MLFKFEIELSDIDRGVYESVKFQVAQHPSESLPYLLSRVLAYALHFSDGIEFSPGGLGDPEVPAVRVIGQHGAIDLWIDIGNPSAKRLHKASKASKQVVVYTYKSASVLVSSVNPGEVHRASEIQIFALDGSFLEKLEAVLVKNNKWTLMHQQGWLDVGVGAESFASDLKAFSLA